MIFVGQAMPPFMEHLTSVPSFSGNRVALSVVFRVLFCRLIIVALCFLSVRLRFTATDYPFDIFKCVIVANRHG